MNDSTLRKRASSSRRTFTLAALCLDALGCLSGCLVHPDSSESFDDEIVFTSYSKTAMFTDYKTFAVNPTVHIAELNSDNSVDSGELSKDVSAQLVARVVRNMTARGYKQVNPDAKPDLGMTLTGIRVGGSPTPTMTDYVGHIDYLVRPIPRASRLQKPCSTSPMRCLPAVTSRRTSPSCGAATGYG